MTAPVTDPSAVGQRIEVLLEASSAAGPLARERAEELVRLVVELYGAGLERVLDLTHEAGKLDDRLLEALAQDELVSGLLLVHGLHPYGLVDRVERALEGVRPFLASHGAEVELLGVTREGVVTASIGGGGHGCGSPTHALQQAIEEAVTAAAPEVIQVQLLEPPPGLPVIPVATLSARIRAGSAT